jgi:hypothetical protein
MRAVAREMVKRNIQGSIVIVASMSGTITNRGKCRVWLVQIPFLVQPRTCSALVLTSGLTSIAYNASKAACLQLCRSAAAEWGPFGIRVNVSEGRKPSLGVSCPPSPPSPLVKLPVSAVAQNLLILSVDLPLTPDPLAGLHPHSTDRPTPL